MKREILFTEQQVNHEFEASSEVCKLKSPLEMYVTQDLPVDLDYIYAGKYTIDQICDKHEKILKQFGQEIIENDNKYIAKVIQLDLLFMFGTYIPTGDRMYDNAPEVLKELIAFQSEKFGFSHFMTYEMIIDLNTEIFNNTGKIRVFSTGSHGLNERDFYIGHSIAEGHLLDTVRRMELLLDDNIENAYTELEASKKSIYEFRKHLARYSKLPKDSFAYFRRYLASYADGTRNASGAFMPSVQLLELILTSPTEMHDVFLNESMDYFPSWAKEELKIKRDQSLSGNNIEDKIKNRQLNLKLSELEILVEIINEFMLFRSAHLQITYRQIPEAFGDKLGLSPAEIIIQEGEKQILEPNFKGTAGFDVKNVLVNSVYRMGQLKQRLIELKSVTG